MVGKYPNYFVNGNVASKNITILENAGHMMLLDQPEALSKFLNEKVRSKIQ